MRGRSYLLAMRSGSDRTYRLSRATGAQELTDAAERPEGVDLARIWAERSAQFLSDNHLTARVRVDPTYRYALLDRAAVSYTHLDVYKRQGLFLVRREST